MRVIMLGDIPVEVTRKIAATGSEIADSIAAVHHGFGFAVQRRHPAGVEMIAADDHGRLEFARRHHLVECEPKPVAIAEPAPADARGQALEVNFLARHVEPVVQMRVVGQQFLHLGIGLVDVLGIARQRRPAERTDAAAEERADVSGNEAGEIESIIDALVLRDLADIIAIIGRRHARGLKIEHRADVHSHRRLGRLCDRLRVAFALLHPLGDAPANGEIAVHRVVRARLVGQKVGADAAGEQVGQDFGSVAEQADRHRLFVGAAQPR